VTHSLRLFLVLALAAGCAPQTTQAPASPAPPGAPATPATPAARGMPALPASLDHDPVRVVVYNIHAGKDADGVDNLERVAEVIRSVDADLVLLQEVDRGTRRSGGVDQLAVLQRLTGYSGAFGRTLDYDGGLYGIALLSRWPIASDTLIQLPVEPPQARAGGVYEPRGAHVARVAGPRGGIGVVNTHMDAGRDDHFRRQEVETVFRVADELRATHAFTVVGGDFNDEPGSAVIDRMAAAGWVDAWATCGVGDGGTFPAHAPTKRIDYLFLPPDLTCERAEVLAMTPSDHRPLLATVRRRAEADAAASAAGRDAATAGLGAAAPLGADARAWVDATLAGLTLRQKAGQLIMPWVGGDYVATDSDELDRLLEWVETHGIGGVVISVGMPHSYASKLNALQRRAAVPLLVGSDMENGPGMRMAGIYSFPHLLHQGGGTNFPPVMALGATRSERLAYELARVLGREARAVGVHIVFGPVVDVNSNPANPIINTRSFGEDPELVARLGSAYVRGARDADLMTTAKHFPGHGDTSEDSHIVLPAITADRARMDAVELPPFRALIDQGVDGVMTAHIAVTGVLGPDAPPATLSPYFMTDVLRGDMGFDGLLFTDAMTMSGVANEFGGGDEVLIRALEAGADVLLMPANVGDAVAAVVGAVESGRVSVERVDVSVRRILEAKARAGLNQDRFVDLEAVERTVAIRAHTDVAREIAERSITLVRDRTGLVPLAADARRILVVNYAEAVNPIAGRTFVAALTDPGRDASRSHADAVRRAGVPDAPGADADAQADAAGRARAGRARAGRDHARRDHAATPRRQIEVARVDHRTSSAEWAALRQEAESADLVIIAAAISPREFAGTVDLAGGIAGWVEELVAGDVPVIAVSFGNPYLLHSFPSVPAYLLAWGGADVSQQAAADAILGRIPITGRLPISLPPHHDQGDGIQRPTPDSQP
jgi:beta-N-acetylhexosaminidase